MNEEIKNRILEKIREHDTIIISRHIRPDGDAVGSSLGLAAVLRNSFPSKRVMLDNRDFSEILAFMNDERSRPADDDYRNALVILLDTGTLDRASNSRAENGACLVKIDHHIEGEDNAYGDIAWVEDFRSSTCEMIVDFVRSFPDELRITREAAAHLYTGLVTDSGRFRFIEVGPETMRAAAYLLEQGIDTERLFADLYIEDPDVLRFRNELFRKIKITENGVAWFKVTRAYREKRGISIEDASNAVKILERIRGSLIWLAFIETDEGNIRVRLRSRFIEVQELASRYHGGGHACASGATVYSVKEQNALISEADALLGAFKRKNPDLF